MRAGDAASGSERGAAGSVAERLRVSTLGTGKGSARPDQEPRADTEKGEPGLQVKERLKRVVLKLPRAPPLLLDHTE